MSIETEPGRLRDLNVRKIFMIGIGGCSMSGLALLLKSDGYDVSGSTNTETEYIPALKEQGIRVYTEDDPAVVEGSDLVIYSHAISMENPVMKAAKENGIPLKSRSWLLGLLSGKFDRSICVCGTHGKTTVTSMLSQIMIETDQDPTVHIGGIYPPIGGNVRSGKSSLFVTEACEYHRSFLSLHPTGIVLLNIDNDHLDCYRDIDEIEEAFGAFLKQLPEDGWVLGCGEDSRVLKLLQSSDRRTYSYGLSSACAYHMENASEDSYGYYEFDFCFHEEKLGHVHMGVPGLFNALNAMSALGAAHIMGIDPAAACQIMGRFRGAHRRFERTGTINGAELILDYGHNPAEIRNAVSIARKRCHGGRLWAVMQPNNYIRVKTLFQDFLTCTEEADITLVTDIYGYKYQDTGDISSQMLVEGMRRQQVNAVLTPGFSDAAAMIESGVRPGDLVLMMGCGNIYLLGDLLKKKGQEAAKRPADQKVWLTERKTECLFRDRRFALHRTAYETWDHKVLGPYYSMKLSCYVVIVAVNEEGRYVCVRQFRQGISQITTEFPAGGILPCPTEKTISLETALRSAKRELLEETGYASDHWTHLFTVAANPTLADNYAFLFLATGCRKAAEQKLDDTEYLEAVNYRPQELETLIREGRFQHPVHILAWYLAREKEK